MLGCKVADFGLSRGTQAKDDGAGGDDEGAAYYRSAKGTFPVRWTSPEAMQEMKFTTGSDVWSYGILTIEVFTDGKMPYQEMSNTEVINQISKGYRHPMPQACPVELYELLLNCWDDDAGARPDFVAIGKEVARILDTATSSPSKVVVSSKSSAWNPITIKDERLQAQCRDFELYAAEYDRWGSLHNEMAGGNAYTSSMKQAVAAGQTQTRERFELVLKTMDHHLVEYRTIFQRWSGTDAGDLALIEIETACNRIVENIKLRQAKAAGLAPIEVLQPKESGLEPTSKAYLKHLRTTFERALADHLAFRPCAAIGAKLGIEWKQGSLKKEARIFEKVLLLDGRFDRIRDYARGWFIIDELAAAPGLLAKLEQSPEYLVVRCKNRLSRSYDVYESCGYRDVQLLVLLQPECYVLEIQIIPREMYLVK